MLQLDKFYHVLKLGVFLSFFMSNFSWFVWHWGISVIDLMRGTFLDGFASLIDIFFNVLAPFVTYLNFTAFVLITVTLFIVFLIDVLMPVSKAETM